MDPDLNRTFAPFCSRDKCGCDAVQLQSVGREFPAMCHHRRSSSRAAPGRRAVADEAVSYWQCAAALYDTCGQSIGTERCAPCAQHVKGCTAKMVEAACAPDREFCEAGVRYECAPYMKEQTFACRECAFGRSGTSRSADVATVLMEAKCNASLVNDACSGSSGGGNWHETKWEHYIESLACMMQGTWYSTQTQGECSKGQVPGEAGGCWWRLAETRRTVNQSCVDNRVIEVVQRQRPACWSACPGDTGTNRTQPCFLECLFDTMVGNVTAGVPPMKPSTLTAAFETAVRNGPENGGCAAVHQ